MNKDIEKRFVSKCEYRASADGKPGTLVGYAAVYDKWSENLGWFREKIQRGAFAKTLSDAANDVRALYNHDDGQIIGRKSAGTLRMVEDATGLMVEIDLPNTTVGRDLSENVRLGNINGMSFGFIVRGEEWNFKEQGQPDERTLTDVELIEVSAVTFPAYPDTTLAKRSKDAAQKSNATPTLDLLRRRQARRRKTQNKT